jgi:uncharacterized protein
MELKGEQRLPVAQQTAWEALNDTALLKSAIPGCESITPVHGASGVYDLVMIAAIGPVKAKFKGKLELADLDPPNAYTLRFEGNGGVAGFGKGSASVRLVPVDATNTDLAYTANASVGGKIAQVGSRLVDMAARKIADSFFEKFNAALKERSAG